MLSESDSVNVRSLFMYLYAQICAQMDALCPLDYLYTLT
jgi:hypothetical protein